MPARCCRELLGAQALNGTGQDPLAHPSSIAGVLSKAFLQYRGKCIYGKNCGAACSTYGRNKVGRWIDDLDLACFRHDRCLIKELWIPPPYHDCTGMMNSGDCRCDTNLRDYAKYIVGREACAWWQVWCTDSDRVSAAQAMVIAMNVRLNCGEC